MKDHTLRRRMRLPILTLALLVSLVSWGLTPASGQITGYATQGGIRFGSGLPPTPFPLITAQVFGPTPLFLQYTHINPPFGRADVGTSISAGANPVQYAITVPTNSFLDQVQVPFPAVRLGPAHAIAWANLYMRLGPNGFPAHNARLFFPLVLRNAGLGSFAVFHSELRFYYRPPGGPLIYLGNLFSHWEDYRPGVAYTIPLNFFRGIPRIPPFSEFIVAGQIEFYKRHRPFGAPPIAPGADQIGETQETQTIVPVCTEVITNNGVNGEEGPESGSNPCQPFPTDLVEELPYPEDPELQISIPTVEIEEGKEEEKTGYELKAKGGTILPETNSHRK